ncbi:MAG: DUF4190 domain-containing protein [Nocardioidaceae bacterium]
MSYTPPPPPPPAGSVPAGSNNKATLSLVLGILSIPLGFCCSIFGLVGIAAILLGNSARKEIAQSGGAQTGDGLARAGVITGYVGVALGVVFLIVTIVLIANGNYHFGTVGT